VAIFGSRIQSAVIHWVSISIRGDFRVADFNPWRFIG